MIRSHTKKLQHAGRRNWKSGQVFRNEKITVSLENNGYRFEWSSKGASPSDKVDVGDRDSQYVRARRSSGWKNSKCRYQWEMKARRMEKRRRKKTDD